MRRSRTPFRPAALACVGAVGAWAGLLGGAGPVGALQQPSPSDTLGIRSSPLFSDLAVRLGARGEFGGDWTLFRPCDASFQLTCRPGLVPQLQPEIRLDLQAEGSVAGRVFVDVNYDHAREFAGSNRFQLHYQGLEGEILQRVELGNVSFALPETRFLTRGIPVGNFGVRLDGQVGGVELQTVFAQQQGARRSREFLLSGSGPQAGVLSRDTLVIDDAEYVRGQFFYLIDPEAIADAPHFDPLALRPTDAPSFLAPGGAPIQLYRMERDPVLRQQVEGYIQADAVAERDGMTVRESGWFRYLRPEEDYYLHPSGLWIALRAPLGPGDALAVTYVAQSGAVVGDYNPEVLHNAGEVPTLRLLRTTQPQHQPGRPTWDLEMKQVYRVSGSDDVDPFSLDLQISLGEVSGGGTFALRPDGRPVAYLRLFGLDEQSPAERVDRAAVFRPLEEEVGGAGLRGTFLVFPALRPFAAPPPVPSEGLSAEEAAAVLGANRNLRIYEAEDPFEREAGGLYRLNLSAEIRSSGVTSVLSLGAFGLREGSERVFLGERLLQPFVDYVIEYQSGVITLLQPEALLLRNPSNRLRVSWEEAAVFRVAPTSVLGMSARVPVGGNGSVDLVGLYQVERELVNRPRFGTEPAALGLVGARSELAFDLPAVDRALDRILGGDPERAGSALRLEGEVAVSLPDPNRSGEAYLDDFDAADERALSLLSQGWVLGSAPESSAGAETLLPPVPDPERAASLVWQHNWVQRDVQGDSIGTFEGFFPAEIDRQINVAGTQTREAGLRLTFGSGTGGAFDLPRWRSFTTLLSPSGADLTYTEFLDFYVAEGDSLTLVLDLGRVNEDAFFVDSEGELGGIRADTGDPWGLGVLDQEGDPLRGEIWSPAVDALGVWPEGCRAEPGRIYDLGDPNANCTRNNGRRDTEDLNGNGVLDTEERAVRYVVKLDGSSPYLVRNRTATGTAFRLFRIPLRGPGAIEPAGGFSDADWRAVQTLRVTVAGSRPGTLTLARMRLVGSRWVKRGVEGVLEGITGDEVALGARLEVSPVSAVTEGGAYEPPPGVIERLDDPTSVVSGRGVEFNERSLRLRYQALDGGDRAEVYFRFLQRPRNFLSYGELRLWAVAREGDWGEEVPTDFFVKVGSDAENFYLYRTPLVPVVNPAGVRTEDWRPERVIDFDAWTELRRLAEEALLADPRGPGDPPLVVWSADSTYAVVLTDRARAPNLAAVRELSLGVWNRGGGPIGGEVWVNELRLGGGIDTPGLARHLSVHFDGGDFLQLRLDHTGQGPRFRQMEEAQTFQNDASLTLTGTLQLGALLPEAWGWDLPLTVLHRRTDRDPFFLEGTDLPAGGLRGLRASGQRETQVTLTFRPEGEVGAPILDRILPGLDARVSLVRAQGTSITTESRVREVTGTVGYRWRPEPRTIPVLPGFLEPIARILLPGVWLARLRDVRFQWTPEEVSARSSLQRRSLDVSRFDRILAEPGVGPAGTDRAPEAWFENRLRAALRPFEGLGLSLEAVTIRDLLEPEEGVRDPRVRPAVERARRSLLGQGIGWETRRELVGRVTFQPRLADWVRTDFGVQTRYRHERDPALVRLAGAGDSIPELLRNVGADRDLTVGITFDPEAFAERFLEGETARAIGSALSPLTVGLRTGFVSRFQREAVHPGTGFQLGWGPAGRFDAVDGVAATSLLDRRTLTAGSGLRLPGTVFLTANVQSLRIGTADRRSERTQRVDTWPDLRAGVESLPLPAVLRGTVERVTLTAGLQRTRQDLSYAGGTSQRHTRDDRRVPVEFAIDWVGAVTTRYRGQFGWGRGSDPTGSTRRTAVDHGLAVETRVVPTGGTGSPLQEPLRLSILLEFTAVGECRTVAGREDCIDFVDQVNRGISLGVDTRVSGFEVGRQASLVDRRSFTGLQTGFTQFQLGLWGRFVFEAGPVARFGSGPSPF